jgi:hypothetical protein
MNKERTHKSNPKKEYLLRKMIDGAKALNDYFEIMRENKSASAISVAEEMKHRYKLTPNQQKYLDRVANRTAKAKAIVSYLESRFGVNADGTFEDAEGLHELLFYGEKPRKLEARSYNIGIGFTEGYWKQKGTHGYKHEVVNGNNCLEDLTDETISLLKKGNENDCGNLAFRIPSDKVMKKKTEKASEGRTKDERLLATIFGGVASFEPEEFKQQVIDHELKHVIDNIIGHSYFDFFIETPAHLYSGIEISMGIERDFVEAIKREEEWTELARYRVEKYRKMNVPKVIIESSEEILEKRERRTKEIKETLIRDYPTQMKTFHEFLRMSLSGECPQSWMNEENRRIKSYLFATMPRNKLFRRTEELVYLSKRDLDNLDKQNVMANKEIQDGA